jgi:serine/threonine protein kinase/WD40 repeat protein
MTGRAIPNQSPRIGLASGPDSKEWPDEGPDAGTSRAAGNDHRAEDQSDGTGPSRARGNGDSAALDQAPVDWPIAQMIAEQRRRWSQGERDFCHQALARSDPRVATHELAAVELIYHEFLLRQESGEAQDFAEHIARYPEYSVELLKVRDADLAFDDEADATAKEGAGGLGRVGEYLLLEVVARGGMGVVFKARQESLNRIVALKMLPDGWLGEPDRLERFRIEAVATASLSHPNIVGIHEVGEHAGQPYLVMEYIAGQSLAELNRKGRMSSVRAAGILIKVADAVHYAHERGTLHRDLKPSNIIIDERGEPRVADFGVARLLGGEDHPTLTGQILGTPSYMPPEQADVKGREIGPASDVYGLGATLYDLLTGQPPFRGNTPLETLKLAVESEPVSPRVLCPAVPRDLETICVKCLQKDPLRRYASAADLADDLRRFLAGSPVLARPARFWERGLKLLRRRWKEAALAAACLAVISSIIWLRFVELNYSVERTENELTLTRERARIAQAAADTLAAKQLAEWQEYRSLENGVRERRTSRPLGWTWSCLDDLARAAKLTQAGQNLVGLRSLAASCLVGVDLRKIRTFDMPPRAEVQYLAYSPDGRRLAMVQLKGVDERVVLLADLSSGRCQRLVFPGPNQNDTRDTGGGAAVFSPEGRWLVLGTRQGDLYAWDTASPDKKRVDLKAAHGQLIQGLAFHPDGHSLFSSARDKTIKCWDIPSGWKLAGSIPVDHGYTTLAFSADRELLACGSGAAGHLFPAAGLLNRPGQRLSAPRGIQGRVLVARFSPDGRFLAASNGQLANVFDPRDRVLVSVLKDPDLNDWAHENEITNLAFSSDGSLIVSSSWDRTVKLWEAATGRLLVKTTQVAADREIVFATFSPRDRQIAVTNASKVAIFEVGGLHEQTIMAQHADPIRAFAFSPDGKALACVSDRGLGDDQHRGELTLWDLEGGAQKLSHAIKGRCPDGIRDSVAFDPEGTFVAAGQSGRELSLVWLPAGFDRYLIATEEVPMSLTFSADGRTLWGGVGRRLISWGVPNLTAMSQWSNDEGEFVKGWSGIVSIAVGKKWIIAGCHDDCARVFRATDGNQPWRKWPSPGGAVNSVALFRDETRAVMGTLSGCVRIVRVPGGEPVADLPAHSDEVTSVALHPDDQVVATASLDRTIKLWKREGDSFQELLTLSSPTGGVVAIRFSPKGDKLAFLVKNESAVRIWHLDRLTQRLDKLRIAW